MNFDRSLFSSVSNSEWSTPQEVFASLDKEFGGFTLDPCATPENTKCDQFYTKEDDGLVLPWPGRVFVNPPFGRELGRWVKRCLKAARNEAEVVVALLPASTDTAWWHDYVMEATEIRFLRRRLKFGGAKTRAPFPSVVVVWGE